MFQQRQLDCCSTGLLVLLGWAAGLLASTGGVGKGVSVGHNGVKKRSMGGDQEASTLPTLSNNPSLCSGAGVVVDRTCSARGWVRVGVRARE